MNDYHIFGWRLRSALPLPDLRLWWGDAREPDIVVEIGPVPLPDPDQPGFSPAVQIGPGGVRLAIPGVADYWVEAGHRVIVQPHLPVEAPDIRVFLLGTVLAILCFQRGFLPLHASAVEVGGRVLLISGVSGAGKSTLAAALSARGYRLLSDDLCALDVGAAEMRIHPAFPRVKLWQDSAARLAIAAEGLERSRMELAKVHVPVPADLFQSDPLPPAYIVLLRTEPVRDNRKIRFLQGVEALRRFDIVHRWRLGIALGQQAPILKGLARLVDHIPVAEVPRSDDLADLPELVDTVLALLERPSP